MNKPRSRRAISRTLVFLFVTVAAAGAQTYSVPSSFDGPDGNYAFETPLIDNLGNVFGTTDSGGGSGNCGVIYELVNNGGGSYTNETLYKFTCGDNEDYPGGGVVMDSAGNLYGVAGGGAFLAGVVYELVNKGGGSYKFKVIHAFTNGRGGGFPTGDLVMFKGSLYGVTALGGGGGCFGGCGTVYRLTKSGGKWIETVLHIFNNQGDGNYPNSGVALDDKDGSIYGTTSVGGSVGLGTVFKLSPQGVSSDAPESGAYKETILHSFEGKADGCQITSGVVLDWAGNIYGAAEQCGDYGHGTVYQVKRSGSKYKFGVIFAFNGTNGSTPFDETGHVVVDSAGNVYGTTAFGGAYDDGTVFKLAAGSFLYTDLHDFNNNGMDGYTPQGGVSLDSLGNLYGTTLFGGSNGGDGTVWRIANP